MPISLPQYLLESSLGLLLFYGFYHFFLRRETFFQLNRFYLLFTPLLALTVPLLNIELGAEPATAAPALDALVYPAVGTANAVENLFWEPVYRPVPLLALSVGDVLFLIYLAGLLVMGVRLAGSLWRLYRLIRRSRREAASGYTLVQTDAPFPAASFFGYVFWNAERAAEHREILHHELVHIRQRHSFDVLLMELMVVAKWFNPLIYWYRRSLRATHEFIADRYVVQKTGSAYRYAALLVEQSRTATEPVLLNTFNSLIKKRLLMLKQRPSRTWNSLKYLGSLPLLGALLLLFSFDLAEELPAGLTEPAARAESYLQDLGRETVLQVNQNDAPYRFQWGDYACDCFRDQLKDYYHCDNLTLRSRELRQLVRGGAQPQIIKDGQALPLSEFALISERTLQIGGKPTQYDDQGTYNPDSPFWTAFQKGDIIKLTFRAGEKAHFKLNLRLNDRSQSYDYAYYVRWGDEQLAIDLENEMGIKYLDARTYQRLLSEPLTFWKNGDEPLGVRKLKLHGGGVSREVAVNGSTLTNPGDLHPLRLTREGHRAEFRLETEAGDLAFSLVVQESPDFTLPPAAEPEIRWGDRVAATGGETFPPIGLPYFELTLDEIRQLLDAPLSVRLDGETHLINGFGMAFVYPGEDNATILGSPGDRPGLSWRERFRTYLESAYPGATLHFRNMPTASDLMIDFQVVVPVEFDPAGLYRDGVSRARFNAEKTVATLEQPALLAWEKLPDFSLVGKRKLLLVVDGEKYPGGRFSVNENRPLSASDVLPKLTPAEVARLRIYLPEAGRKELGGLAVFGALEIETRDPTAFAERLREVEKEVARQPAPAEASGNILTELQDTSAGYPLFIIDGERYAYEEAQDRLQTLSPEAIESVTVLKGEMAAKLHGEAARDGAVVVVTKGGATATRKESSDLRLGPDYENILIVIDGRQYDGETGRTELEALDPNQIQDITVLKGDKAVARFGEAGREGVIVIRTKGFVNAGPDLQAIDESFTVFPNPASDLARVNFTLPSEKRVELAVFSPEGQRLTTLYSGRLTRGAHLFNLERLELGAAGAYLVHLTVGKEVLVRRVVFK